MKKVILFDLDGTLLPMNADLYDKTYFTLLTKEWSKCGYDKKQLLKVIRTGLEKMVSNDGSKTNEQVFWDYFVSIYGEKAVKDRPYFDAFYIEHYDELKQTCGFLEEANEVVKYLKGKGYRLALTTNPVFPKMATQKRIIWAGLDKNDFELVTTYEDYHYCKPNSRYFQEVLDKMGVKAKDCIMVGNDMIEDLCAEELGVEIFMLTHNLINRDNKDISLYANGTLEDFLKHIGEK